MKSTVPNINKKSVVRLTFSLLIFITIGVVFSCNEPIKAQDAENTSDKSQEVKKVEEGKIDEQLDQTRQFRKDELLGKLTPSTDTGFIKIQLAYTKKPAIYLRKAPYESFIKLYEAANKSGIKLMILSATRNFDAQKSIWEKKWSDPKYSKYSEKERASQIMKFSSMPGTSRHHWGTDVDFNNLSPSYFESGQGKKIYDWLVTNAADYGFYQTYTNKSQGRTGYEEEKWHWTYLPLSGPMLDAYNNQINYSDITGFKGSEAAVAVQAIELYVNGIDSTLKSK